MYRILSLLLLYIIYTATAHAQVMAIEPDTVWDKYYINYPIDPDRPEYMVGDTVVKEYYSYTFQKGRRIPAPLRSIFFKETRLDSVIVVRAVVTDVILPPAKGEIGAKLKVYSIVKHIGDTAMPVNEYKHGINGCVTYIGQDIWHDAYGWLNTTGLYRIRKFTDNYRIGDTIHRTYFARRWAVGRWFEPARLGRHYELKAVVLDMDTSDAQTLLLRIIDIKHVYLGHHDQQLTSPVGRISYNGKQLQQGDTLLTKPYGWLRARQTYLRNNSEGIPDARLQMFYGMHFSHYDCEGKHIEPEYDAYY